MAQAGEIIYHTASGVRLQFLQTADQRTASSCASTSRYRPGSRYPSMYIRGKKSGCGLMVGFISLRRGKDNDAGQGGP
jgi:hypothetical protein